MVNTKEVIKINDGSFDKVINSGLTLVDFWAEWCGPCRAQAPILDDLAAELGDHVKITKLNVDDNPQSSARYGIRSIPTLILFKDGQVAKQYIGVQDIYTLRRDINEFLN
ncbi:MAG: thioredoxin [Calditrichaeota bacterium]|nr:thioredoxin [Calditrichota bacterium]